MYNILKDIKHHAYQSRQYINKHPISKTISLTAITGLVALVSSCTTVRLDPILTWENLLNTKKSLTEQYNKDLEEHKKTKIKITEQYNKNIKKLDKDIEDIEKAIENFNEFIKTKKKEIKK